MSTNQSNTFTGSTIQLIGESKIARQRNVVHSSPAVIATASFNLTGKIGREIRSSAMASGRSEIQFALANGNFRPLAQFLALQFGESVYIRNQAEFFALDGKMRTHVDSARSGKNLGMRIKTNKTTGEQTEVMGTKLADAVELHDFVTDLIAMTKSAIAAKADAAEREAAQIAEATVL